MKNIIIPILFVCLGIGFLVAIGFGVNWLTKQPLPTWTCGEKVIDLEVLCKDGYEGCSKIYRLENGTKVIFSAFKAKQDEQGRLCVRDEETN